MYVYVLQFLMIRFPSSYLYSFLFLCNRTEVWAWWLQKCKVFGCSKVGEIHTFICFIIMVIFLTILNVSWSLH